MFIYCYIPTHIQIQKHNTHIIYIYIKNRFDTAKMLWQGGARLGLKTQKDAISTSAADLKKEDNGLHGYMEPLRMVTKA